MEATMVIAKLAAILYLAVGLGILLSPTHYRSIYKEVISSPTLTYFSALMALFFGTLIVLFHNIWVQNWPVLITLIGWIGMLKGTIILIFPKSLKIWKPLLDHNTGLMIGGLIAVAIGGVLGYFSLLS
ncbi:hypothetical protein GF340_00480 [Candidatus Peregrinibacteria bacterium]|nr:hypothetical protein [Candidatus Peregrinibacteria bacterium]